MTRWEENPLFQCADNETPMNIARVIERQMRDWELRDENGKRWVRQTALAKCDAVAVEELRRVALSHLKHFRTQQGKNPNGSGFFATRFAAWLFPDWTARYRERVHMEQSLRILCAYLQARMVTQRLIIKELGFIQKDRQAA